MLRFAAAAGAVAIVVTAATAPAAPPPTYATIGEAVRGALETGEGVRIADAEARKAGLRTRRYRLAVTPDVRLRAAYVRLDEETSPDQGQGGGAPPERQLGWSLELTQPLYTGGRATAAYEAQRALEGSAGLGRELARRETALAAAEAWYGVLAAAEGVRVGEEAVGQAQRHLERTTRRVELGEAVLNDRLQAEVSLRQLESSLAASRGALANARERLRRIAGGYPGAEPAVPIPVPAPEGSPEELVAEALAHRLEPQQAGFSVTAAEQDLREKRGRFLPSLALTASYARQGEELDTLAWQWSAGVALELPLYQSGQRLAEMRESRVGLEQARLAAEAAGRDVEFEVRGLVNDLGATAARIASLRAAEAAATENLRFAERRYDVGLADGLEVVDARVSLTAARTALAAERYRIETLKLRLAVAVGRDPVPALAATP